MRSRPTTRTNRRNEAALAELDEHEPDGRYDRLPGTTTAEVAFVVADAHQGHGIATVLLEQLATARC